MPASNYLPITGKTRDLTNIRFGMLIALGAVGKTERGKYIWECLCDCGRRSEKTSNNLIQGSVRSCGCASAKLSAKARTKHGNAIGGEMTRELKSWYAMIARCENPKARGYNNYGGRGIKVCERWHLFENFKSDMGECPPRLTLDRLNNDGNYEPSNCQWRSRLDQQNNRRCSVRHLAFGETGTIKELCRKLGKDYQLTNTRVRRGIPIEEALTLPPKPGNHGARTAEQLRNLNLRRGTKMFTAFGVTDTLIGLSRHFGQNPDRVWARVKNGMDAELALSKPKVHDGGRPPNPASQRIS